MDSKQFDELVARLASGQSRREALKGLAGGTLAAIGVTTVDADVDAKGKRKSKNRRNHRDGSHRGKGGGDQKANAEKKKNKKKCKKKPKDTICHNGQTITISHCALNKHLKHGDTVGPCYGGVMAARQTSAATRRVFAD